MKISPIACSLSIAAVVCGLWASTGPAAAAAPAFPLIPTTAAAAEGITVTVTGKHLAAPSHLAVTAKLKAFGATGTEAAEAFDQKLARSMAGLGDTALEGVTIHPGGCSSTYGAEEKEGDDDPMSRMVIMGSSSGPDKEDEGLNLSQSIELRVPAASEPQAQRAQLAELVDASVDRGLSFPAPSNSFRSISRSGVFGADDSNAMVRGRLDADATAAAELAAQTNAVERARRQAAQLAQLGGRQLGKVVSINQRSLNSSWKGIGEGTEFTCELIVSFEVL